MQTQTYFQIDNDTRASRSQMQVQFSHAAQVQQKNIIQKV